MLIESPPQVQLTDEQERAVVQRSGSLLLAAGAGSGKTSVLVERYAQAAIEDGVEPSQILAITFTERAAWELKERLRLRFAQLGRRDLARDVEAAAIGTFHGFCARLLRSDPLAAGLPPGFAIVQEGFAERMRLAAFADALRSSIEQDRQAFVDLAAAYGVDRLRRTVLRTYAELRSAGEPHPQLTIPNAQLDRDAARTLTLLGQLLESFDLEYERVKRTRSALDFDDLELRALALLEERPDLREHWAQRLQLLMVDELQDTNRRQLALLATIERDNLFTVGDEWQSIYGFRNADVSIFRERAAALAERGASLALRLNFRSRPPVIDVVNRLFSKRFGDGYRELRAARPAAQSAEPSVELLLSDKDGWGADAALAAALAANLPPAPLWRQAEARLLSQRIAELVAAGRAAPGDVAVLLRATGDLPVYERALAQHGLPTLATVGSFWDGAEVADLIAYLRALANPLDELALHGTLASPLAGVSLDALALLARAAREQPGRAQLWATIARDPSVELAGIDRERLAAFRERFAAERARVPDASISDLLRAAIAGSRYDDWIEASAVGAVDAQRRLANVRKLVRLASEFEHSEGRDLRGFLDHVSHLQESRALAEPEAPAGDGDLDAVALMSIHAAKGLEFPVVCVADLGRTPSRGEIPDLIVDGARVGLRLLRLSDPSAEAVLDYEALREQRDRAAAEEEDRVLYVAITRARELLLLSGAASFARWPASGRGCPPIAWLAPALVADLPERLAAALASPQSASTAANGELRCLLSTARTAGATLRLRRRSRDEDPLPPVRAEAVAQAASARPPSAPSSTAALVTPAPRPPAAVSAPRPPAAVSAPRPPAAVSASSRPATLSEPSPPATPRPLEGGSLSYTTLAELERCGYRHYLERVLLLPEMTGRAPAETGRSSRPTRGRMDARALGEVAHRLLERVDFARPATPSADEVATAARELGFDPGERDHGPIGELLAGLHATPLAKRLAAASQLRRELPFAFSIGAHQPSITGVFDLIATESSGTRLVVDYKSGAIREGEDLEKLVAGRFGAQQLIYALAALRDGAAEVEIVHWFLQRPQEPVHVRFDRAGEAELVEALHLRVNRARARGYAVTEHPHRRLCLACPGRATRLCSWEEEQTLRPPPSDGSPSAYASVPEDRG